MIYIVGGRAGGGGEVHRLHHRLQGEVAPPPQVLQQRWLQTRNCAIHTYMGVQTKRFFIQSELENLGQGTTFQPCNQSMQTVCEREILDPQKTSPCISQPSPRNWNFLPRCEELTFEKHQESESTGLVWRTTLAYLYFVHLWCLSVMFNLLKTEVLPHETEL